MEIYLELEVYGVVYQFVADSDCKISKSSLNKICDHLSQSIDRKEITSNTCGEKAFHLKEASEKHGNNFSDCRIALITNAGEQPNSKPGLPDIDKKIIGLNSLLLGASHHNFFLAKFENEKEKFFIAVDQQSTQDYKPMVQIFLSEQSKESEFQKMLIKRFHCKEIIVTPKKTESFFCPDEKDIDYRISEDLLQSQEPESSAVKASANSLLGILSRFMFWGPK